jgi:beta-mannosidase
VDDSLLSKNGVYLVAKGIDTVSSVYININDKLIGTTNNMFVRYKFDVKQVLKTGQNKIRIAFESRKERIRTLRKNLQLFNIWYFKKINKILSLN